MTIIDVKKPNEVKILRGETVLDILNDIPIINSTNIKIVDSYFPSKFRNRLI